MLLNTFFFHIIKTKNTKNIDYNDGMRKMKFATSQLEIYLIYIGHNKCKAITIERRIFGSKTNLWNESTLD